MLKIEQLPTRFRKRSRIESTILGVTYKLYIKSEIPFNHVHLIYLILKSVYLTLDFA